MTQSGPRTETPARPPTGEGVLFWPQKGVQCGHLLRLGRAVDTAREVAAAPSLHLRGGTAPPRGPSRCSSVSRLGPFALPTLPGGGQALDFDGLGSNRAQQTVGCVSG